MADDWHECVLGDVVELKRGYDLPQQDRHPGAFPVVSSSGISDYHQEARARGPGVVTGRYGTLGQVFYVDKDFWPLNTTLYVRDFKGNEPRFISYFLRSLDFLAYSDKAAVPGLNRNHLHQAQVRFPHDRQEQRAIAHILGTLDDKIEVNRHMNETLETMARALFKSWFVDFDPVRATLDGTEVGLAQQLAHLFPASFEQSEERHIPIGWSCRPLSAWVDTLSGGTPPKNRPDLWNGDIPWISPKVMTALHADEAENCVTEDAIGNGTRLAPAGSTLVMVRGMGLHEEVRISQARRDVAFNQDVKALVPRDIEPNLLLFALLHAQDDLLGRVESSGHGTGRLPSDVLLASPITMPERQVQTKLAGVFDRLNARIASARDESRTLVALREALLPELLAGRIRVPHKEEIATVSL